MKKFHACIFLFFAIFLVINVEAQNTPEPNYELAARFSPDQMKKMVFSTSVSPHWLKNSDRFWYSYETSDGKSWYLVDPVNTSKENLFDNVQIASDMSKLTGDPFDPTSRHRKIEVYQ